MYSPTLYLDRILAFSELVPVFAELKKTDPLNGGNVETAMRNALADCHEGLWSSGGSPDKLRFGSLLSNGMTSFSHWFSMPAV